MQTKSKNSKSKRQKQNARCVQNLAPLPDAQLAQGARQISVDLR
jgi:hypothetical protein